VPTDPDDDVLALVDAGDVRAALHLLVRRHGAAIYRCCREALRDAALADDVHQQVFLAAFRDLPRLTRRSSVRGWLFGIARHRVIDAIRSRNLARARQAEAELGEVAHPEPPAGALLDAAALGHALSACLRELAPEVATAVVLRYHQGLSFEEMAAQCGARATTLQARVARALPRLRKQLERQALTLAS
jgi:RNA polymerase sigma-70 factor (ECF subfamily)